MNLETLIAFLGHASAHPPLDDFLEASGIKKRPKGDDSLIAIYDPTKSISLEFSARSTYDEDVPDGARSEGWYILRSIFTDKKYSGGPLPFGLDWKQSKPQIDELLGKPLKTSGDLNATYYKNGLLIVVSFSSGGRAVSWFRVAIKDRYHTKNLGI